MTTNTSHLPVILRNESFGGILFYPGDATLLELDKEAFQAVTDYFNMPDRPFSDEAAPIIRQINELILEAAGRSFRIIRQDTEKMLNYDFPVFGAPTLVDFQITSRCLMACPHCYASASPNGNHVSIDDIEQVLSQSHDCGVCQIALGGGEPLLHPHIGNILELCHEYGIVPNLTTNGMHLTDVHLKLLKTYCGAAALSLEAVGNRFNAWRKAGFKTLLTAMDKFKSHNIPTVLQVTLSRTNFDDLDQIVDFCLDHPHLYGVIFLAYKPVGRGEFYSGVLADLPADDVSRKLKDAFLKLADRMRVGYDCCMTPGIAGVDSALGFTEDQHLQGCSAFRGSVGISTDLDVIPCTFLPKMSAGNLKNRHLKDIWTNGAAHRFRQSVRNQMDKNTQCRSCSKQLTCLGGCPVMNLVNCHKNYLSFK